MCNAAYNYDIHMILSVNSINHLISVIVKCGVRSEVNS
jgi:hypothetical protein